MAKSATLVMFLLCFLAVSSMAVLSYASAVPKVSCESAASTFYPQAMGIADFLEDNSDCDIESHPTAVAKEIYEEAGMAFPGSVGKKWSKDVLSSRDTEVIPSEDTTKARGECEDGNERNLHADTPLPSSGHEYSPLQKRKLDFSEASMPTTKRLDNSASGFAAFSKEGNSFKAASSVPILEMKDNGEVIKSLHDFIENVIAPQIVMNVSEQSTTQLLQKAEMDFLSGLTGYAVANKRCVDSYHQMRKERDDLQACVSKQEKELEVMKTQMAYDRSAHETLRVKNEALLLESFKREEKLKEKNQLLEIQVNRAIKGRRELLSAVPQLCERFLDHPHVDEIITEMNKIASAFGKHRAGLAIKKLSPEEAIAKAATYVDPCIRDRATDLELAFKNHDFPILKRLAENPDASIEELFALFPPKP